MTDGLLKPAELAERTGHSVRWFERQRAAKLGPTYICLSPKKIRYTWAAWEEFKQQQTVKLKAATA